MILSIDIQLNSIECHYAECRDYLNVMRSVVRLNVIMLSVVRLNVVMLSVVAPSFLLLLCVFGATHPDRKAFFLMLLLIFFK